MANETTVTIIGNLTKDPELRYTQSGQAIATFTVASTSRRYNSRAGKWENGDTLFMRCQIWRDYAEHVAESLKKGTNVIVQGRLKQRQYETRDGEKRTMYEIQADEVGVTLRYATAQVEKATTGVRSQDASDTWGQPAPIGGGFDEAPF